jgi:hypothetical protein
VKDGFWVAILVTCAGALGWLALGELRRKGRRHTSSHDGAGGDGGGWFDGHGHSSDHGSGSDAGGSDGDGGEDGVGGGDGGGGGD